MKHRIRFWLAALAVACTVGGASTAAAESASAGSYEQHFRRGVELFRATQYEAALAEFVHAHELRGHFAILLNIAYCHAELGRVADAIATFERFLDEGGRRIDARRRAEVTRELDRLRAQVSSLTVTVDVDGAAVLVDGREVGTSPLSAPLTVRTGAVVTVEARLDGFRPARHELTIAPGTTPPPLALTLERVRRTGRLRVESEPPGATVSIDGAEVGATPWSGELDEGSYRVAGRVAGFVDESRDVAVSAGGSLTVRLELDRAGPPARLLVEASVEGAAISIDGERVGTTPLAPLELPAGPHEVGVEADGHERWSGSLFLDGGQLTTARVELASSAPGLPAPVFWSTLALALAAGAGAVVTGALAVARNGEVEQFIADAEAGLVDDSAGDIVARTLELQQGGRDLALATDVLWISSAVLAAATLVLGFFTRFGPARSGVEVETGATVLASGAGLRLAGRF